MVREGGGGRASGAGCLVFFAARFGPVATSAFCACRLQRGLGQSFFARRSWRTLRDVARLTSLRESARTNPALGPTRPPLLLPLVRTAHLFTHAYGSHVHASMSRQWNFNEGRSPWGMKNNAEIWNGRLAQMGFVIMLLQEVLTGKGVIQGIQDGDSLSFALLGFAGVSTVGLTAWLALKGDEDDITP